MLIAALIRACIIFLKYLYSSVLYLFASSNFLCKLELIFPTITLPGFGGGVSAGFQSQDAPPGVRSAAARCPALSPPPDPAAAAAAPAAAAADTSGRCPGNLHTLSHTHLHDPHLHTLAAGYTKCRNRYTLTFIAFNLPTAGTLLCLRVLLEGHVLTHSSNKSWPWL